MSYSGSTSLSNRRDTVYYGKNIHLAFEMDRQGIAACAVGPELRAACNSVIVDRAKPYAISISPYDPEAKHRHYRDSFEARDGHTIIAGMRRVACRLFNTSDHSTRVEWQNGSRVLTRTLGYLNHESIMEHLVRSAARAAKQAPFNPAQHPRGARGRFIRGNHGGTAR